MEALRDEGSVLASALAALPGPAWHRSTRCTPWQVRELVGHIVTMLARVADALAVPAPDRADTTATRYFRGDERFSSAANADRVIAGAERAATLPGAALAEVTPRESAHLDRLGMRRLALG